jgi:hypothetical protein
MVQRLPVFDEPFSGSPAGAGKLDVQCALPPFTRLVAAVPDSFSWLFLLTESVPRSAFSHQLNEQIHNVMIEDKVGHLASGSTNLLFLLKADC